MTVGAARAALITGTVGVGKTAVAVELGRLLGGRGLAVAVIDLDWLGWFYGTERLDLSVDDAVYRNLLAVCSSYSTMGVDHFVLTRAVWQLEKVERIRSVFARAEFAVVRLIADAKEVERRLRARDEGAELAEHLAEAQTISESLDKSGIEDFALPNDSSVSETARALADRLAW